MHHASYIYIQDRRTATPQSTLFIHLFHLTFMYHASYIQERRTATPQSTLFIYLFHLTFMHHESYIYDRRTATPQSTLFIYLFHLTFMYHASYIYIGQTYRYSPEYSFLYIQSTNIFNYFFRLSLTIFIYSSTKCRVFPNVTLLGS